VILKLNAMTIGANIKSYREAKRLSQEELAYLLHVSQPVISSWESDRSHPNSTQLPHIADALGVEIMDLFKGVSSVNYFHNQDNKDNSINGCLEVKVDATTLFQDYITVLKELNSVLIKEVEILREEIRSVRSVSDKVNVKSKAKQHS
jgi:transcriptional regulator with XRE-family HTH domain